MFIQPWDTSREGPGFPLTGGDLSGHLINPEDPPMKVSPEPSGSYPEQSRPTADTYERGSDVTVHSIWNCTQNLLAE